MRYLRIEAKRRLSAGEFASLHLAQLAIAREYGMASWAALKERVEGASHALAQVRWILSRFAAGPVPDEGELRRHFADHYLRQVPPRTLTGLLSSVAGAELVDVQAEALWVRARLGDLRIEAATEADPPYRLRGLRLYPLETRVSDPRVAAPGSRTAGVVPEDAAAVAADSYAELGLVGLTVAGPGWVSVRGWADLDRGEVLTPEHRFPAYSITKLVTAVAVLRLVADGLVRLDDAANAYLRTIRLADGAVTVRELLSHTGGVDDPSPVFADRVPDLVSVTGPVAPCGGVRGTFAYGHGGYALLGQLIADLTGSRYEDAATGLVLRPLGLTGSSFGPTGTPITGHRLTDAGVFEPAPTPLSTMPAAGGLWTTAADLVRFGHAWSSLLPAALAREALTPQAERDDSPGGQAGLGWMLALPKDVAGHPGAGPGCSASLIIRPGQPGQTWAVLTNRAVLVEAVNERLALPLTGVESGGPAS